MPQSWIEGMAETELQYSGLTTLVVDDEPESVARIRLMLEQMGFEVVEATTGRQALEQAIGSSPDLVVAGVSMPGMSGIEFMRKARKQGLKAPVIMITSVGSVTAAVESIKAGAHEFLEKPLTLERLSEVVGSALPARRSGAPNPTPLTMGVGAGSPGFQKRSRGRDRSNRIGRYEMLNPIGRGGMGVVYRCTDPLTGEVVAVKILQVYAETPEQQEEMSIRFKREAAATQALDHPHIVKIREQGFDEKRGEWYIAMELLEGRGLHVIVASRGSLKPDMAIPLGFQVADALAYAHRHKVIHRDIKPSNVHVRPDGTAKLLDFGLAAMEGWEITLTGRVFGSPSYMAPERINGATGGPPADQFSLGIVLYESISGSNPFDSEIPEAKLRKVLKHRPPTLVERDASVPPALSHVIARMMEKREADRYPSMDHVADEFQKLGHDLGIDLVRHGRR